MAQSRAQAAKYRELNREKLNAYQNEWRKKNAVKIKKAVVVYRLKRKYGISLPDYEALLRKQNGVCAVCGRGPEGERYGKLNIDHCHETGRVRGLLCTVCNHAIGRLGDNLQGIWRVVRYLTDAGT